MTKSKKTDRLTLLVAALLILMTGALAGLLQSTQTLRQSCWPMAASTAVSVQALAEETQPDASSNRCNFI